MGAKMVFRKGEEIQEGQPLKLFVIKNEQTEENDRV